ncbi:F-box protein SKIP23-like [Pistacia vera]|uniref:F-box protein SKIP23-like n=1 Tax=Pistacia vera TaxID=55513 RepID=UPI001263DA4A|nr:F-box protein SKIP23-like [Pistacia vera]
MATPDWSSLPDHVLAAIAKHLQTPIDTLCFRAVCNSFRFSIPPPKLPSPRPDLKISIPPQTTSRRGHLVLAEITFYAIEPHTKISYPHQTETWVVKMEELNSGKVRLEDPLCRLRLGNLSNKIPKLEKLPESLNLLDYRVKEVAKAFRLEMVAQGKGINRKKQVVYSKAVVCTYQDNRRWGSARCMEKCRQEMAYHRHGL